MVLTVQIMGEGGDFQSSRSLSVPPDATVQHQLVERPGSYIVRIERQGTLLVTTRIDVVQATEQQGESPFNGDYLTLTIRPDQGITARVDFDDT